VTPFQLRIDNTSYAIPTFDSLKMGVYDSNISLGKAIFYRTKAGALTDGSNGFILPVRHYS